MSNLPTRKLKRNERLIFHVFADMLDDFTTDLDEANKLYDDLVEKGFPNVRLYWEIEDRETGDTIEEDCIRAQGEFPY